jgi:holo-[acyl-carrier protein] synthase
MIVGIGADLVEIARIAELLDKSEPLRSKFLARVLTPGERELAKSCQHRLAEFVAGRFAAKESAAKALGTGIGKTVGFQDIEITPDEHGRPVCSIDPEALARAGLAYPLHIHLSITHSEQTAAAFVVLESRKE